MPNWSNASNKFRRQSIIRSTRHWESLKTRAAYALPTADRNVRTAHARSVRRPVSARVSLRGIARSRRIGHLIQRRVRRERHRQAGTRSRETKGRLGTRRKRSDVDAATARLAAAERKVRLLRSIVTTARAVAAEDVERMRKLGAVRAVSVAEVRNAEARLKILDEISQLGSRSGVQIRQCQSTGSPRSSQFAGISKWPTISPHNLSGSSR